MTIFDGRFEWSVIPSVEIVLGLEPSIVEMENGWRWPMRRGMPIACLSLLFDRMVYQKFPEQPLLGFCRVSLIDTSQNDSEKISFIG